MRPNTSHFIHRRRLGQLALALAPLPALAAQPASTEPSSSIDEVRAAYLKYLREEGFSPRVLEKGSIEFKREGLSHGLLFDENDPHFFQLILSFEAEEPTPRLKEACNQVNTTMKWVKVYISASNNLTYSVEALYSSPAEAVKFLPRAFSSIQDARRKIREAR